ncbi:MAG TPA: glycosyltransferase [Pyrinomonadaceae bacterium]|nr:glycosyltransferase [Pyrinomonadaceae bacterium]
MRVLHVIPAIADCYGGPSKVVFDTCKALRDEGVDAEIATTNASEGGNLPMPASLPTILEDVPVYVFERRPEWRYKVSRDLTTWLNQNVGNYDLLHIHALFSYSTAAAAYCARRHHVPYIMLPHGMLAPWPIQNKRLRKSIYLKAVEKNNISRAAAVHFTTEDELRTSVLTGRANFVLPYIISLATSVDGTVSSKPDSRPQILYLSRLDPKKGIEILIQALAILIEDGQEFNFVIAGSGDPSYEKEVKAMVSANDRLASVTQFVGFVRGPEKAALIQSSDVFVLPSHDENFGIAVAEAMAAGLAVIVSDKVNIHEDIQKNGAGLVVSPVAECLGAAILELLRKPELRADIARKGRQLVRTRFSPAAITRETLQVYRDVIQNSRKSTSWRTAVSKF